MAHLYNEEDLSKLTDSQIKAIKMVEKLGNKLLGEDFKSFAEYMKLEAINIKVSRSETKIALTNVTKDEVLDILFPNVIKRILNFYEPEERTKVILKILRQCKDGKEELCIEEEKEN